MNGIQAAGADTLVRTFLERRKGAAVAQLSHPTNFQEIILDRFQKGLPNPFDETERLSTMFKENLSFDSRRILNVRRKAPKQEIKETYQRLINTFRNVSESILPEKKATIALFKKAAKELLVGVVKK